MATITKMQAAMPSRNNPAPRRRPGRLDEAAADIELGATAEQAGLNLCSRFCHLWGFPGSLMHSDLTDLRGYNEDPVGALYSTDAISLGGNL